MIIYKGTILYILGGLAILFGLFFFFPNAFMKKTENVDPEEMAKGNKKYRCHWHCCWCCIISIRVCF